MKIPPFTLVHRPIDDEVLKAWGFLQKANNELARSMMGLKPNLRNSLIATSGYNAIEQADDQANDTRTLEQVVKDLNRQPEVLTVGIWDLGAYIDNVSKLIERLNKFQSSFTFFQIQAAIPAGMISQPQGIARWAKKHLGHSVRKQDRQEIKSNIIDGDFFKRAGEVREDLGLNYLIGITPDMVAGLDDEGSPYWNYFSSSRNKCILASTFDLRAFAKEAGRPFEVAVAFLAIGQLLVEINSDLGFHEDRGCLFDFNEIRAGVVRSLKELRIEGECLDRIDPDLRSTARRLIKGLDLYSITVSAINRYEGLSITSPLEDYQAALFGSLAQDMQKIKALLAIDKSSKAAGPPESKKLEATESESEAAKSSEN